MSRQEKFYLETRKPSGIYYYIVRDPVSRKTTSDYFRELETMGKEPQSEHAFEMQKKKLSASTINLTRNTALKALRYALRKKIIRAEGFNTPPLGALLRVLNPECNSTGERTIPRCLRRGSFILKFDFENVLRAGGKSKLRRGVLTNYEVEKLFKLDWACIRSRIAALIA